MVGEVLQDQSAELRDRLGACRIVARLCPLPAPREPGLTDPEEIELERARREAERQERERRASLSLEQRLAEDIRQEQERTAYCHALMKAGSMPVS